MNSVFLDVGKKKLRNLFFIKYLSFFRTLLDRVVAIVINSISSAQNDILMQWIESKVHFEVLLYVTAKNSQYVFYLCIYYSV